MKSFADNMLASADRMVETAQLACDRAAARELDNLRRELTAREREVENLRRINAELAAELASHRLWWRRVVAVRDLMIVAGIIYAALYAMRVW